jgi:MFS family permease
MACSMPMMAFVTLAGPVLQVLGLAPWQFLLAVTVSGVLWMLMARPWGAASDRLGRRPVPLTSLAGFACAYLLFSDLVHLAL